MEGKSERNAALPPSSCWALALGGTRRAYIAQGGRLAGAADVDAYFTWIEAEQLALLDRLYGMGVQTMITVGRLPADRGATYQTFMRRAVESVVSGDARRAFYARRDLQVSVAGDLDGLAAYIDAPHLADACVRQRKSTAAGQGGQLIYLWRGPWADAAEEARWGFNVGMSLGRAPTRDELVRSYYALDVPPVTVYVGSGRPRVGALRPPFLGGQEDYYWAENCPVRLADADWARLIADHTQARQTQSARGYPTDAAGLAGLRAAVVAADGRILGVGAQHPAFGYWRAEGWVTEKG